VRLAAPFSFPVADDEIAIMQTRERTRSLPAAAAADLFRVNFHSQCQIKSAVLGEQRIPPPLLRGEHNNAVFL